MLIHERKDLADGEIELVSEFPPEPGTAERTETQFRRLQADARTLDAVLADPVLDLCNEWVAVFDGETFRAGGVDELLAQFEAHGVNPGRAVKHYISGCAVIGA
jgi:hypothetical protein